MKDINGRPYAEISKVQPGTWLVADGDFTCLVEHAVRIVKYSDDGLYIQCNAGRHYLEGQIQDDHYIGLYIAEKTP